MEDKEKNMANEIEFNPAWLKVSCFLTRRPDLSHDEFYRYWTEVHTPMLAKPMPGAPTIHRYVQLYPIPQDVPALKTVSYDAVAEIWFDSLADAAAMFTSDHYNTVVAKDEENFLDRTKTVFLYTHEKLII